MRALLSVALAMLVLTSCSSDETYRGGGYDYGRGSYGGGGYYNSSGYGAYGGGYSGGSYYGGGPTYVNINDYSYYYPFGNMYYPRDRIWIIPVYGGCSYFSYRGYCYRDRDDFDRVVIWDRMHGYDDAWFRRRESWCSSHDCHHNDVVRDANGRPLTQPTQSYREQTAPIQPPSRVQSPVVRTPYPTNVESHERQPPVRVDRDYGRSSDSNASRSETTTPVVRPQQPVFMPRNRNDGWGGGSDSASPRVGVQPPVQRPSEPPPAAMPHGSGGGQQSIPARANNPHSGGDNGNARPQQHQRNQRPGEE